MKDGKVYVDGIEVDAARLLAALHNNTIARGYGRLHDLGRNITVAEAREDLAGVQHFSFDYYRGRPLKMYCADDGVIPPHCPLLYDRDAGAGAFARALREACE